MVQRVRRKGKELFRCEACGFHYRDEGTARKCEAWRREHKSCNLEITRDALENQPTVARGLLPRLLSSLGVAGCVSCYAGHFPLAITGVLGLVGVSSAAGIVPYLDAYVASPWFVPVLVASVILIIAGTYPLGKPSVLMAIAAGAAMIASMTVFLNAWLFISALLLFGAAHAVGALLSRRVERVRAALIAAVPFFIVALLVGAATVLAPRPETDRSTAAPSMIRMER